MTHPYTEEDRLTHLMETSANFRRLFEVFDLELDFTKQPPVKYKGAGGYVELVNKKQSNSI